MIYKFKCKASGDLIMLEPHGDQVLRLMGREPAGQGIVEVAALPAAIAALEQALARAAAPPAAGADDALPPAEQPVALRSRRWPMLDMLKRAQAAGQAVVWGV